jgi:hypothetical protein
VAVRDGDTVEAMEATISIVKNAEKLLYKIGTARIDEFIKEGVPARAFDYLVKSLL